MRRRSQPIKDFNDYQHGKETEFRVQVRWWMRVFSLHDMFFLFLYTSYFLFIWQTLFFGIATPHSTFTHACWNRIGYELDRCMSEMSRTLWTWDTHRLRVGGHVVAHRRYVANQRLDICVFSVRIAVLAWALFLIHIMFVFLSFLLSLIVIHSPYLLFLPLSRWFHVRPKILYICESFRLYTASHYRVFSTVWTERRGSAKSTRICPACVLIFIFLITPPI